MHELIVPWLALGSCTGFALLFVVSLYVSSRGRGHRDSDDTIRARLYSVIATCIVCAIWTWLLMGLSSQRFMLFTGLLVYDDALRALGSALAPLAMTMVLFAGPLTQLATDGER
jgi:hypothetical protein